MNDDAEIAAFFGRCADALAGNVKSTDITADLFLSLPAEDLMWLAVVRAGTTTCPVHGIIHGTIAESVADANAACPAASH